MSFNRKNIRNLILLEIIKKIDSREIINEIGPLVPLMLALEQFSDLSSDFHKQLLSGEVYKTQKEFFDKLENPEVLYVDSLNQSTAGTIAKDFYIALIGESMISTAYDKASQVEIPIVGSLNPLGMGTGTDEEGVESSIRACKTQLGLSRVGYIYSEKMYPGRDLAEDIRSEFGPLYLEEYVTQPINSLPFAILNGKEVTLEEYKVLVEQAGTQAEEKGEDLSWGLEAPYVRNIILTMNEYAKVKSLKNYNPASGSDWTSAVQSCWVLFSTHALTNCALYSSFKPLSRDVASWKIMSRDMRSTFPGYTGNPRGCLAFCLDAYYCELRYGNKSGGKSGAGGSDGGSGGGSGGRVIPAGKVTKDKNQDRTYRNISVNVTSGGETVPLSTVFDATVQKDFIYELEQNFKESVQQSAVQKSTMQIDLIFDRGFKKVRKVQRRRPVGGSSRINFKGNLQKTFDNFFNVERLARAGEGNLKSYSDNKRMRIEIDIPANYTPTRNRRG